MNSDDPKKLEARINRVLRSLPDRKAPSGLEARVLAELSRRAALPWWRKSYAHWPAAARAVFFVGSALAAALVISGLIMLVQSRGANELASSVATSFGWLFLARDSAASLYGMARMLLAAAPPLWLYGGLATVAACYAALAAIGAATYRTLSFGQPTR
jgi:hypothetical protein